MEELGPVTRVNDDLASHDEAILIQLSNVLAYSQVIIKFCKVREKHPLIPNSASEEQKS